MTVPSKKVRLPLMASLILILFSLPSFAGGNPYETFDWGKDGKCYETNAAGDTLRETNYRRCKDSVGSQYLWADGACWELTAKGDRIRKAKNDYCSGA